MAASKAPQLQRSVMSEPRVNTMPRHNFNQPPPLDDRFLFNLIGGGEKEEMKPNNYYNWRPSSTFAEPAPAVVRSKKSKNREREQNSSGNQDPQGMLLSNGPPRHRTPATYPRTQQVSYVDRLDLENLRHQLTYSDVDDQSTDSQALGSVSNANRVNNTRSSEDIQRPMSVLDTIFVNESPDRNKIVARLMQIRDYLKQANAMMSTLQNSMDSAEKDDQVIKLHRLQDHLQEQEKGYLGLLEGMLAKELGMTPSVSGVESSIASNDLNGAEAAVNGRSSQNSGESFATSVAESASINFDARSDISEATTGQKAQNVTDQAAALEGLRKQHDLLKKMLKQQEELKTLQNRQAALMTLQNQIEGRMNISEQEQAETLSISTQATTTTATSVTEDTAPVTTMADVSRFAAGVPMTESDLQERRRTLLRMLAAQADERSGEIQQARRADWMDQRGAEVAPPLISQEHQELREKLEALQEKKRQMDDLLTQLHDLHPNMPTIGDTSSIASTSSNMNEGTMRIPAQVEETSDENEATLTNGPDSLRKLHEVRNRLTELRDLVQQYQDTSQLLDDKVEEAGHMQQHQQQHHQQADLGANFEDPELMRNLRRLERGEQVGRLSQLTPNQMAYVQVGSGQTTSTVTETETETETESNHSSILAAWGDDPEIQEKVRKLRDAKQKLRQLQSLVAMVQQTPEVATALPDDLAELAADLTADYDDRYGGDLDNEDDDDDDEEEEEEDTVEESGSELLMGGAMGDRRDRASAPMGAGEVPPEFARQTKEAYYEAKMLQQRRELQNLMAERQRLLTVQHQLKELNDNLPPARKEPARPGVKSVNIVPPPPRQNAPSSMNAAATPSRDEVYAEMWRNRMLHEELQQKKSELSDLLSIVKRNRERSRDGSDAERSFQTDLAAYDNDLFRELLMDTGRMSMRSADITAAATWGGSTQVSEDEGLEDGYPSDGILQVEEEEEQAQSVVTSETYTVESGSRPYRRRPDVYPGVKRVTLMEDDGETSSMDAARHGIRYPKNTNSAMDRQTHARQENIRTAEELVSDSFDDLGAQEGTVTALQGHIHQLQRQLSNSMTMCQSLISDQQSMSNLLSGSLNAGYGGLRPTTPSSSAPPHPSVAPSGGGGGDPPIEDLVQNYNMRLQHQQLMLNLNSAYGQLYDQQEQIQRLRTQLEEFGHAHPQQHHAHQHHATNANANNNAPPYHNPVGPWGVGFPGPSPSAHRRTQEPSPSPYRTALYNQGFSQPSPGEYPPSSSYANPYAPNNLSEGGRGRDDYTLYARQPTTLQQRYGVPAGASYKVPPNTAQVSNDDDEFETAYLNGASSVLKQQRMNGGHTLDSGIGDVNDLLARDMREMPVPPLDISSILRRTEQQRRVRDQQGSQRSNTSSMRESGKHPMPSSASQARAQLSSQSTPSARLAKLVGPSSSMGQGLSSSISGTAFLDTASMTSTVSMSSLPGEMSDRGNGQRSKAKGRVQQQQQQQQQDTDRSIRSQTSELESDAGSEFSLFEALRESIYSEVASLISQNETRPHFLIELFRELQMLNSDYLRQRALYALQDLVSKYLTDDNNTNASASDAATLPSERPMPNWMQFTGSEHTPSESFITSDEEEIKARLFGGRTHKSREDSYVVMEDEQYDYIENVDSASTLSTPPSIGQGEFGFANDDLGDTVIHLDKALKRMREYERMKAEAEGASGATSSLDNLKEAAMSASDMTSNSSAQDMGSESSFSDLPYPRIDTRQLDLQIKGIMQEVIPYLKEHMDDVCSPQLLAYIRRLVLGLARQRDESREFVRFFNRQLGSILEDSLAKFSGRKMRECGEDLLVDISEILFNELAFFRLMHDLDTAGNKLKKEAAKRDEQGNDDDDDDDEEDDDDEDDDEDDEEEQTETGTETGTAQDQGEESSSEESSSSDEDDTVEHRETPGGQQGGGGSRDQMEDALNMAMDVASRAEEEHLGNARDDVMAFQVDVSDREEDSEPQGVDHLQIELSMSESKGVTYIGSGEEEDDPDNLGEAPEETITSIGAANADGEVDSVDETAQTTEVEAEAEHDSSLKENASMQEVKENASVEEEKEEEEGSEKDPDAPSVSEASKDQAQDQAQEQAQAELGENNNEEITVDDLPSKLTVLSQTAIDNQMSKEQAETDSMQGVLETMAMGEGELAGDPQALRVPEGAPVENGIAGVDAGDIVGSE